MYHLEKQLGSHEHERANIEDNLFSSAQELALVHEKLERAEMRVSAQTPNYPSQET